MAYVRCGAAAPTALFLLLVAIRVSILIQIVSVPGKPAKIRRCKSAAMKEWHSTLTPSRAPASAQV